MLRQMEPRSNVQARPLSQDIIGGEKQAAKTLLFQTNPTPSTPLTPSTISTTLTTEGQQSLLLRPINDRRFHQLITNEGPYVPQYAGSITPTRIHAAPFADNESVFPSRNDFQGFIPDCSPALYSPSRPQALLDTENLFRIVSVYFRDSCQNMVFDEDETLLGPDRAELHNGLCSQFDSYCFTATMFKRRGMYNEFGRSLTNAFALVNPILRAEHPRTLACFLEVFIHLI
jgi:hypothetical protein